MIVQEQGDGSLIMIGQTDHARLSGQLAAHWGNDEFAKPQPFNSVARAAMYHDSGWYGYETNPTISPETKKPMNFLQVPWGPPQRKAFQWAIDWMTDIDPYSGALLSRHRTGLQRGRYGVVKHPVFYNTKNILDDNVDFLEKNEQRQLELVGEADKKQFEVNFKLFQTWDLLSLELCNKAILDNYIDPVPKSYNEGDEVQLRFKSLEARTVEVTPYPFDMRPLNVHVYRRRLPAQSFDDQDSFIEAYYSAELEVLTFKLI